MTKKKRKTKSTKKDEIKKTAKIIDSPVSDVLKDNYMPYVLAVIVSRALPSIDGLKPSQRKLLYTMWEMGLGKKGVNRKKSSTIVGQAMNYNPHGDQSMYETMVRLTTSNGTLLHPYIDSKGSWGHRYSNDQAAAHRYTEARLAPITEEMFKGIKDNQVDFKPNFDNSTIEPILLPTTFPNILINPSMGIAVGMASNIPSFNLLEVVAATKALIKSEKADTFDYIQAPDFSTGAQIVIKPDAKDILEKGRGSFTLKSKYNIDTKNRIIEVTEIPYTVTSDAIIEQVKKAVKDDRMREISDIRDESDLNGLKIAIDYKLNTDVDLLVAKLFEYTKMEDNFACNFNLLINEKPVVLGLKEILIEWLDWRRGSIKRRLRAEIVSKEKELHLMYGLEKILVDIDKTIKVIRKTKKANAVVGNLMKSFNLDEIQADYVSRIMLRNINEEYIIDRIAGVDKLRKEIMSMEKQIKSKAAVGRIIAKELDHVAKTYGQDRKTEMIDIEEHTETDVEDLSEDYNLKVFVTKEGYVKKMPLTSLRSGSELKLKDDDEIVSEVELSNRGSEVIIFTNKQKAHKAYIDEMEDNRPSEFGHYADNLCELEADEEVIFIHVTDENFEGEFVIAYQNGKIAKVPVSAFTTKTRRKSLANSLYDGSEVIGIKHIAKSENILITTNLTRGIMLDSDLIPLRKSRSTQGVQAIRLKKDEEATHFGFESEATIKSLSRYKVDKIPTSGTTSRDPLL